MSLEGAIKELAAALRDLANVTPDRTTGLMLQERVKRAEAELAEQPAAIKPVEKAKGKP